MTEIRLVAEADYAAPFDVDRARLVATLEGPGGRRHVVPGFWDGERDWVVRFTPTAPGMAAPLLPTYRDDAPPSRRTKATTAQSPSKNKKKTGNKAQARRSGPPPGLGAGVGAGL